MDQRCDQIVHCKDKSDEDNCKLIVFENNYNNKVPPFSVNSKDGSLVPVKVKVSTSLMKVLAISEFSHTINLKLGITLKWYDNRVLYHNLKTEEALNVISDDEVKHSQLQIQLITKSFRLVSSGSPTSFSGTRTVTRR